MKHFYFLTVQLFLLAVCEKSVYSQVPESGNPDTECTLTTQCDEASGHNFNITLRSSKTIIDVYCEREEVDLVCPPNQVILIFDAMYGRQDRCLCPHAAMSDTDCSATNAKEVLTEKCGRLTSNCKFRLKNSMFGDDPCIGTFKYLRLSYVCADPSSKCEREPTTAPGPDTTTIPTTLETTEELTTLVQTEPPADFKTRLIEQNVTEGYPVEFVVKLTKPVALVTWTKGDSPIERTDRIQATSTCTVYTLIITETWLNDTGLYYCELPDGKVSLGKLTVFRKPDTEEQEDAPVEHTAEAAQAEVLGSVGIILMIFFGVFVASLDLMTIKREFRRLKRNLTCR